MEGQTHHCDNCHKNVPHEDIEFECDWNSFCKDCKNEADTHESVCMKNPKTLPIMYWDKKKAFFFYVYTENTKHYLVYGQNGRGYRHPVKAEAMEQYNAIMGGINTIDKGYRLTANAWIKIPELSEDMLTAGDVICLLTDTLIAKLFNVEYRRHGEKWDEESDIDVTVGFAVSNKYYVVRNGVVVKIPLRALSLSAQRQFLGRNCILRDGKLVLRESCNVLDFEKKTDV